MIKSNEGTFDFRMWLTVIANREKKYIIYTWCRSRSTSTPSSKIIFIHDLSLLFNSQKTQAQVFYPNIIYFDVRDMYTYYVTSKRCADRKRRKNICACLPLEVCAKISSEVQYNSIWGDKLWRKIRRNNTYKRRYQEYERKNLYIWMNTKVLRIE